MPDSTAFRVFISYSRTDGLDLARRLHALLEAAPLSLYRDLSHLWGDKDWWRQVEEAIKAVEHVVLLITPHSLESRYFRDEWRLARQEGKTIWLACDSRPLDLSRQPHWMQQANRHDIDKPESLNRLIAGLKAPAPPARRAPFMADQIPSDSSSGRKSSRRSSAGCSTRGAIRLPSPPRCAAPAASARRRWPTRCATTRTSRMRSATASCA